MMQGTYFEHLPITFYHAEQAGALPVHHRDPFDRMLLAQAQGSVIMTADQSIPHYGVRVVRAWEKTGLRSKRGGVTLCCGGSCMSILPEPSDSGIKYSV